MHQSDPQPAPDAAPRGAVRLSRMTSISTGFSAGWLVGRLRLEQAGAQPTAVEIHCDGEPAGLAGVSMSDDGGPGVLQFAWEAPRTLNDGRRHILTLHDPRDGKALGGDSRVNRIAYQSTLNSFVELTEAGILRGWVIDPDRPTGGGVVELYEDDRLLAATSANIRREDVDAAFGREGGFGFKLGLPASLFDGRRHELAVLCDGQELAASGEPRLSVQLEAADMPRGAERYAGEVTETSAEGLKGYVIDQRDDTPVQVEVRVDGDLVATLLADQYAPGLRSQSGSGFHAFAYRFPAGLMTGRNREVRVRISGADHELPARHGGVVSFPLVALDDAHAESSSAIYAPPRPAERPSAVKAPSLRRVLRRLAGDPLISLVVLNRNGETVLEALLQSLVETSFRDRFEVVLVDHGSQDASRSIIERYAGQLDMRPILLDANRSFSQSSNLGAEHARGEFVAFVNNDVVFTHDCLAPMRDVLDTSREVGLVGAKLLEPRYRGPQRWALTPHHIGVNFEPISTGEGQPRVYHPSEIASRSDSVERGPIEQPAVTGALMMARRADFLAMDGFDEAYLYGYEDIDLALRMRRRTGRTSVCQLDALAVHNRSATRGQKIALSRDDRLRVEDEAAALANRDLFLRRFAKQLPRTVLQGLVDGEARWRESDLRVTFVVEETGIADALGDDLAAHKLGRSLRDTFGWEVMFCRSGQHDLAGTDVLVVTSPDYDLDRTKNANPGLIAVAWVRDRLDGWLEAGRFDHYPVLMTSWPEAARAITARSGRAAAILPVVTNLDLFGRGRARPEYACDICIVGDAAPGVGEALAALGGEDIPFTVNVWGQGWEETPLARHARGRARYFDLPDIYASARLVVDARRGGGAERDALNPEVFDALAAGALVLTDCAGDAEEQFGGLLPTFDGPDELFILIVRYLADTAARDEAVKRLQAIVCARHSVDHRARVVRRAMSDFLSHGGPRVAIRGRPDADHPGLRRALEAALKGRGCLVRIEDEGREASGLASADEIVIHFNPGTVTTGAANLLYLTRAPDASAPLGGYDHVFASDPAIVAALKGRTATLLEPADLAFGGEAAAEVMLRAAEAAGGWTVQPARRSRAA